MSARAKKPTNRGPAPPPPPRPSDASLDDAKTNIYDSGNYQKQKHEPKHEIKAVSMKTPGLAKEEGEHKPAPKVKIRSISDVMNVPSVPQDLGRLAPPRDASAARVRKLQDYVLWGSVSVILASIIALAIWFIAR
jgi:hypothetical protein